MVTTMDVMALNGKVSLSRTCEHNDEPQCPDDERSNTRSGNEVPEGF